MFTLLNILLTVLLLLIVTILLKGLKTMRTKSNFVRYARSKGYLVYEHPFAWFSSGMFSNMKEQLKKYNDSHYLYKHELSKYDIIVSNVIFGIVIEIVNPDLAKELYMKANDGHYVKADFGFAHLKRVIDTNNVLLSEGNEWKERRKLLSTVFNYDFIVQQIGKIQKISKTALERNEKENQNNETSDKITCNIESPLMEVFSTVILKCFFQGDEMEKIENHKIVDFVNDLLLKVMSVGRSAIGIILGVKVAKMGLTKINREINHGVEMFRNTAKVIIEKRIKEIQQERKKWDINYKPKDIVEALMKSDKIYVSEDDETETSSLESGPKDNIDIDSIISEFLTFFLAGTETTFAFTRMMIYRLASEPEVLKKVKEEFEREVNTEEITLNQLKNLKYFENVQKEVLRMDSSVGGILLRTATKDHYLGDLPIRKDMIVTIRLRALHYKENDFAEANKFNPDRWNNGNSFDTYSYLPFSAGARNCIGKHLALLENKILMIELLRKYKEIQISKDLKDVKMFTGNLYGPEQIKTTLIK